MAAQNFASVVGQQSVKNLLLGAVQRNHVSHALHFVGPEGSGNLSLALAFAAYLLCNQPGEHDACGSCPSCIKMASLQHPDLHFLFPVVKPDTNKSVEVFMAEWRKMLLTNPLFTYKDWMQVIADENKTGIISVHLAQEIQQKVNMKSFEGGYRIALIWMPETMKPPAANKLLKVIEEPPAKTLFLLVGNSRDTLLPTILSRLQTVKVPPLADNEVETVLRDKMGAAPEKARHIALMSAGNLRDALLHMQEEGGQEDFVALFGDWFRACYKKSDGVNRIALSDRFSDLKREGQKSFLAFSLKMLRQCMLVANGREDLLTVDGNARKLVVNLAKAIPVQAMPQMAKAIDEAIYHIERNAHGKITFVDLSIQIKNLFWNS
ncbi:MAG: DNA polymerase III subunit delta [Cryomorphaceae bacterium]|nr:MAG: DNA polymerase III subunit delta [Cryomorphaceae bacterium]